MNIGIKLSTQLLFTIYLDGSKEYRSHSVSMVVVHMIN